MRKRTIHKAAAALTALALCAGVLTGCGGSASSTAASSVASSAAASSEVSSEEADELAAKNVADLIDAIYVQERNDNTDEQCAAAKAAWDALTDAQKELVEGEEADPDYFGRDTGDASKDDSRNEDNIGDNELLVVSFGTSFNDSRVADIKGIEDALQEAYPDWSVRRAFTAQIIINHVQARDGEKIDNMQQAMDRAVANGVKNLVVQPTHLMHGAEYDEMMEMIDSYRDKFESVAVAEPLLGEVGSDAAVINADKGSRCQGCDRRCREGSRLRQPRRRCCRRCGLRLHGPRHLSHRKGQLQPDADHHGHPRLQQRLHRHRRRRAGGDRFVRT